jgi:hypothetical protein
MMDKTLTIFNGCHLVFDHGQLLLEGLLGLPSACNDSRSQTQHQELVKHTELA